LAKAEQRIRTESCIPVLKKRGDSASFGCFVAFGAKKSDWKLTILIFNKLLGVKDIREKLSNVADSFVTRLTDILSAMKCRRCAQKYDSCQ
jgi:hypothetical protein